MHRLKTVAQILLILSILNSALAAPVVLQKRPNEPQAVAPVGPDAQPSIDLPSSSQPQLPDGPEHPSPQLPADGHQHSEFMASEYLEYTETPSGNLKLLPPPTVNTGHSEIQPYTSAAGPQHGEIQPYTSPPASPAHPEPQSMTTPPQPVNKAPSKAAWRQKIMTPEKIKATKFATGAFLLTSAYMGLLFPEIMNNDNTTQS